jgi:anti-sigma28 factor (negative regulator of flagellin synthesis)
MSLWLKIILAIVIWFVVALIVVAILQINGSTANSPPSILGTLAAGLFLIFARGKDKSSTTEVRYGEKAETGDARKTAPPPRKAKKRVSEVKEVLLLDTSMEVGGKHSTDFVDERLAKVKELLEKGLLTPDEAAQKRKEILKSL